MREAGPAALGVSVIVCCHNSRTRLAPTLEHLAAQQVPPDLPWEVIVIDNASTDGTGSFARAHWPASAPAPLRVVDEPRLGLSAARECGFANARYGLIVFVDDDNWVCPSWVAETDRVFREHPEVGVCGGDSEAVFEVDPPWWFQQFAGYFAVGPQGTRPGDITNTRGLVWGAGMCVRASAWAELQKRDFQFGLSDRLGDALSSGGDCELCFALRLIGWRIWYEPALRLKHYMPARRLQWNYLLRLALAVGESASLVDAYSPELAAVKMGGFPAAPAWTARVCRQLMLLARHPLKLILARFVHYEGDMIRLNQNLYLGHLLGLFRQRSRLSTPWITALAGSERSNVRGNARG